MKSITIPERFGYPTLEITINGKEQTFNSGVEIEVEDSVAEAIENAIALAPKQEIYKSRFAQRIEGSLTDISSSDFEGIRTIAAYAFADCNSIRKIIIPNGINSIKTSAFYSCSNLESVEIGNNVISIEATAFDWCVKLAKVCLPEIPPTLADTNAFQNLDTACVFYCKSQASLDAYKAAANWSTLTGTYTFKVEE